MFGPSGFWTMAPLRYAAKFDPFLSLDCAPRPPPWHNPRKGRDKILPSGNLDIRRRLNSFIGSKAAVERCAANWAAADSAESRGLRKE